MKGRRDEERKGEEERTMEKEEKQRLKERKKRERELEAGISKVPRLTHWVCYRGLWQGRARVTFPVISAFSLYHPDPLTVQASRDV